MSGLKVFRAAHWGAVMLTLAACTVMGPVVEGYKDHEKAVRERELVVSLSHEHQRTVTDGKR
jgi:hypothetical protein